MGKDAAKFCKALADSVSFILLLAIKLASERAGLLTVVVKAHQ